MVVNKRLDQLRPWTTLGGDLSVKAMSRQLPIGSGQIAANQTSANRTTRPAACREPHSSPQCPSIRKRAMTPISTSTITATFHKFSIAVYCTPRESSSRGKSRLPWVIGEMAIFQQLTGAGFRVMKFESEPAASFRKIDPTQKISEAGICA